MYLANEVNELISLLKADDYFSDKKVIAAFPYAFKPTLLSDEIITVSPSETNAESCELGGSAMFGTYKIDFDVFIPQKLGSPCASEVAENIIRVISGVYPAGVFISKITSNDNLECFLVKCTFTFSFAMDFSEKENEQDE